MKDYAKNYQGRAYDVMFYADTEMFTTPRVQAFKCPPNDDDIRWVPEFGCSTTSVYATEQAARASLVQSATKEHAQLKKRMALIESVLAGETVNR